MVIKSEKMAAGPLSLIWNDRCDIFVCLPYKKENGATAYKEKIAYTEIPCHVSYIKSSVSSGDNLPFLDQKIKLFLSSDIDIRPGSKISVNRGGFNEVTEYQQSGKPAKYSTHQEIELALFKGWG
ncbi:MAG: hypothetical protein LBR74_04320 [Eubacterium sp.]|jgi:hypothetical protein|nr:hypothetical protein [Eubacterium sp.]